MHELAFRSQAGVAGSWLGLFLNVLVLVAQFWTVAWPLPKGTKDGLLAPPPTRTAKEAAKEFFLQYLCAPIVIAFYVGYKIWYRTSIVRIDETDVDTGRRDFHLANLLAHERDAMRAWPRWKRIYKFLC